MKKNDLKKLYKNGLIGSSVFEYIELKDKVGQYERQGKKQSEAIRLVSSMTGKSERTIYRALKATKNLTIE